MEFDDGSFGGDYYSTAGGYQGAIVAPSYTPTPSPSSASTEYTGGGYTYRLHAFLYGWQTRCMQQLLLVVADLTWALQNQQDLAVVSVAPPIDYFSRYWSWHYRY